MTFSTKKRKRNRIKTVQDRIINNLMLLYGFDKKTAVKVEKTGLNPLFINL